MSSPSAAPTDASAAPLPGGAIDIGCPEPPEEVLEQIARADAINSRLWRRGRAVRFALGADGRVLQIELCDARGRLVRTLGAAELAEIASGRQVV